MGDQVVATDWRDERLADLYALKSHFDFVVTEDEIPIFAVEFDGPMHAQDRQRRRDMQKFKLCRRFEFPMLRITAEYLPPHLYRGYDMLTWCIESWFHLPAFREARIARASAVR